MKDTQILTDCFYLIPDLPVYRDALRQIRSLKLKKGMKTAGRLIRSENITETHILALNMLIRHHYIRWDV